MQTSVSPSSVSIEETARWYDGKQFHTDWTSWHFPNWMRLLTPFRDRPARMLEIGSWEGRSAIFFLNYLPQVRLTCVDTFAGGQEHQEAAARTAEEAAMLAGVEARFDANTSVFSTRLEKVKASSVDGLI